MDLVLLDGNLNIQDGQGSLQIQGARLNLNLARHRGDVQFTADKGQLKIDKLQGKLTAHLMEGALNLSDFHGDFIWRTERAALVSTRGNGKWDLQSDRGSVKVDLFKGQLKGAGDKARWRLNVADTSEVEIHSVSGPVRVHWNKGAAKAFLLTKSGGIQAPVLAKVQREEGVSKWLAQWGQGQLGQLFVNTQSGSIFFSK